MSENIWRKIQNQIILKSNIFYFILQKKRSMNEKRLTEIFFVKILFFFLKTKILTKNQNLDILVKIRKQKIETFEKNSKLLKKLETSEKNSKLLKKLDAFEKNSKLLKKLEAFEKKLETSWKNIAFWKKSEILIKYIFWKKVETFGK